MQGFLTAVGFLAVGIGIWMWPSWFPRLREGTAAHYGEAEPHKDDPRWDTEG